MATEQNELKTPEFETLLAEEKLIAKDLPKEIYNKINTYKMGVGRYKLNPTEKALQILKTSDVAICDLIQTHVEEAAGAETPEEIAEREAKEKEAADKIIADKAAADKEAADKLEADRLAKEKETAAAATTAAATGVPEQTEEQKKAIAVEAELAALFKAEKYSLTLAELKQSAPVCYADIFQAYKEGEENGIMTSRYLIKETEKEKFTLSKL